MAVLPTPTYPGGSRTRVNRAGANIRNGTQSADDLAVVDLWRAAHRAVLNTFQAILRYRTRGSNIVVAQRHKRRRTIFGKLQRFPEMRLARMDDVAGCRLIFENIDALYSFREEFHGARFKHVLRNEKDKYDYIKAPKPTGYRGVHDVYSYNVRSPHGAQYEGLLIELQYRTAYQHAWATCVEVVGFITESQPKFEQGDLRYQEILRLSSEIISRTFENRTSCLPEMEDEALVVRFLDLDDDLHLMQMLRGLNSADSEVSDRKNVILIFSEDSDQLEVMTFRDATDALRKLFELEQTSPEKDAVLVRAETSEEVRIAFRNYFSDARDFIDLIERGCQLLVPKRVAYVRDPHAG